MARTSCWRIDEAAIVSFLAFLVSLANVVYSVDSDGALVTFVKTHSLQDAVYLWMAFVLFIAAYLIRFSMSYELVSRVPEYKDRIVAGTPCWYQVIESTIRTVVGLVLIVGLSDYYRHIGGWVVNWAPMFGAQGQIIATYTVPVQTKLSAAIGYYIFFFLCCISWDIWVGVGIFWKHEKWKSIKQVFADYLRAHVIYLSACVSLLALFVHGPALDFVKGRQIALGFGCAFVLFVAAVLTFWKANNWELFKAFLKHLKQPCSDHKA